MELRVTDRNATRVIRELAERQHGVVGHWQLVDAGVGLGVIQRRAEGGFLIQVFQGVYALGHRRLDRLGYWMAAVLASGPGAVLSHGSAMALWGMRGRRGSAEVLRRSGGVHRDRQEIRVHQTRALPDHHVTVEQGIPITAIERTLLDMAGRLDAKQLERSLVAADRSGRVNWPAGRARSRQERHCSAALRGDECGSASGRRTLAAGGGFSGAMSGSGNLPSPSQRPRRPASCRFPLAGPADCG
jgi:hypothetical protein